MVVGKYSSTLPHRNVMCWVKRNGGKMSECSGKPTLIFASKRIAVVFNHPKIMFFCQLQIIKKFEKAVKTDKAGAEKMLNTAFQAIDKTAQKGVIKKNNAARKKARLARLIK